MRRAHRLANQQRLRRSAPRLELEIGTLVLNGLPASGRTAFGEAFAGELERLLAADDLLHLFPGAQRTTVTVVPWTPPAGSRPEAPGLSAAQAVHAGLGGREAKA